MNQPFNPVETLIGQYKQGYKTSEFWVALAAGIGPAVAAAFDSSKPVTNQLSNVTWVAIAYILARAGLKVVRNSTHAKIAAAGELASAAPSPASYGGETNGGGFDALDTLIDLRDRGIVSDEQYDALRSTIGVSP